MRKYFVALFVALVCVAGTTTTIPGSGIQTKAQLGGSVSGVVERSIFLNAQDLEPDADGAGNQCVLNAAAIINGGPLVRSLTCDDSNTAVFYYHFPLPRDINTTGVGFTIRTPQIYFVNVNATPSGVIYFSCICQIRDFGAAVNSTY